MYLNLLTFAYSIKVKLNKEVPKSKSQQKNNRIKALKTNHIKKNPTTPNKVLKQQPHYEPPSNNTSTKPQATRPTINKPKTPWLHHNY